MSAPKHWKDLTPLEFLEKQIQECTDPARKTKMEDAREETLRLTEEQNKKFGPPKVHPPSPTDPNQRRIQILKEMERPEMDPMDRENLLAVVKAYETGVLDISKKTDPHDCALFWGGLLKRNWNSLDDGYFEREPTIWKQENPIGRLWVEEGTLRHHF